MSLAEIEKVDQTPIDVVAALRGSPYQKYAEGLAKEFKKARIEIKGMVQNAPLKLKVTFGVDMYEVMRLIVDYEAKSTPSPKTKGVK